MRKKLVLLLFASAVAMLSLEASARVAPLCPDACRPDGCCQRCTVRPSDGFCHCGGQFICS